MPALKQLDELIEQARKLSDKSRLVLTGQLEDLRRQVRYCFEQIGDEAKDALRAVSRLEFTFSDTVRPEELQAKCSENLAMIREWLQTVRNRVEGVEETEGQKVSKVLIKPISAPAGTKWSDVKIRFTSDFQVQIYVGENAEVRNYIEMGFEDRRKKEVPDSAWAVFRKLAEKRGVIASESEAGVDKWTKVEKAVQSIRKRLRLLFQIPSDPFERFRDVHCYKTRFSVECVESYHR